MELAAWVPPAAVTCTAAAQISSPSAATTTTLLAAGCADGSLCRLRVSFPRSPGATIAETKLNEDDFEVADLVPWRERLHSGAITSVAVPSCGGGGGGGEPPSSAAVATAGADGAVVLTPLDSSPSSSSSFSSSRVLVPARPAASISAMAWASADALAACGSASPVELFDVRSRGGRAVSRAAVARPSPSPSCSSDDASSDASLLCIHPARPNLAATGGIKGVALWDLRVLGKGAVASLGGGRPSPSSSSSPFSSSFSPLMKGGVTGLAFDPLPSVGLSDQTPRLLFSTGLGVVGSARLRPGATSDATVLYREAGASALALAVGPSDASSSSSSSGRDIFVSTDQECLIYMQRPLI